MSTETMDPAAGVSPSGNASGALKPVSKGFLALYGLAYVGLYTALITPVALTMAVRVGAIDAAGKGASLGIILGIGALFALFANPIFGKLSDLTTSRFGRRRPWLIGGVVIGMATQLVIGTSTSLLVIGISWCVAQAAYNAALAAIVAVVADQVPEQQRGTVSALAGMSTYLSILIGSAIMAVIGTSGLWMFVIPGLLGVVTVGLFCMVLKDTPLKKADAAQEGSFDFVAMLKSFWIDPRKAPDFGWAWLSRFFVFLGAAILTTYQVYYLTDHIGIATDQIGGVIFLATLITAIAVVISSAVSGWLSDHLHRRKMFVGLAAVIYAIGLAIVVIATGVPVFLCGVAVAGFGLGVYLSVDQALVVDILPDRETDAGKNMGILNIANAVPQSIAPAIAPIFLAIGSATNSNYPLLFAMGAVFAFIGAITIAPVKGVR